MGRTGCSSQLKHQKDEFRFLKLLNSNPNLEVKNADGHCLLISENKHVKFETSLIEQLYNKGHIVSKHNKLSLTQTGKANLKRLLFPENPYVAQNSEIETQTLKIDDANIIVSKNVAESPLSRLYLRKGKSGKAWISSQEFQAGEKIRSDFERAQLQPRISANLEASVASKSRNNTAADMSDFAMDCKMRLDRAVEALGPELNGITLDVCCYLKGLETIEKERGWPPRSAKLMLKTALSVLVRHYGIGQFNKRANCSSWTSENYRPTI